MNIQLERLAGSSFSVSKALPAVKPANNCIGWATGSILLASESGSPIVRKGHASMIDAQHNNTQQDNGPRTSTNDESKIPSQLAENIRRISHDLSNALEVILQTNYLLGMADGSAANDEGRKWREMLDQGVMQATQINRELRDYVRSHS
jgi:hypothetical protein